MATAKTIYRGTMVAPLPAVTDIQALFSHRANIIRAQTIVWGAEGKTGQQWLDETIQQFDYIHDCILPLCDKQRVIIDVHTPPGGLEGTKQTAVMFGSKPEMKEFLKHAWEFACFKFKDDERVKGYDILNEPRCEKIQAQNLMHEMVLFIRKFDPTKKIIISPAYGNPGNFRTFAPIPKDTNIWYTCHFYRPDSFSAQGLEGRPIGKKYPTSGFNKVKLKEWLKDARDFQVKTGKPMYIGEFSATIYGEDQYTCPYIADLISIYEEYGWNWTFHAWREANVWNPERSPQFLKVLSDAWKKNRL